MDSDEFDGGRGMWLLKSVVSQGTAATPIEKENRAKNTQTLACLDMCNFTYALI